MSSQTTPHDPHVFSNPTACQPVLPRELSTTNPSQCCPTCKSTTQPRDAASGWYKICLHRFDGMLRTILILIFMGLAPGLERKDTPSGWYNFRLCHLKSMRRSLLVILLVVGILTGLEHHNLCMIDPVLFGCLQNPPSRSNKITAYSNIPAMP